jgi:hypothetical protein
MNETDDGKFAELFPPASTLTDHLIRLRKWD